MIVHTEEEPNKPETIYATYRDLATAQKEINYSEINYQYTIALEDNDEDRNVYGYVTIMRHNDGTIIRFYEENNHA